MADNTTDPDRESMLREAERGLMKTRQRIRMLRLEMGDCNTEIARLFVAHPQMTKNLRGEVIKRVIIAIDAYQAGGFSRQAEAVGRWSEWLRRAWRRAGGEE